MVTDDSDFFSQMTDTYREKVKRLVDDNYNEEYLAGIGDPEAVIRREFPRQAWEEIYTGCLPPVRQLDLVYELGEPFGRDRDVVMGLVKQIHDEAKHGRVISKIASEFGADADPVTWEAPYQDELVEQVETAMQWDEPHFIASGLQLSSEITAAFMIRNLADYVESDYPNVAATLRNDVAADEGDHLHVGRLLGRRFAEPGDYERMEEIAARKFDATKRTLERLEP